MVLNGSSQDSTELKKKMPVCNSVENLNCFYLIFFENSETLSFNSFSLFALVLNFSIVNCWSIVDCSYLKTQITVFLSSSSERIFFRSSGLFWIWINIWGSVDQQPWNQLKLNQKERFLGQVWNPRCFDLMITICNVWILLGFSCSHCCSGCLG